MLKKLFIFFICIIIVFLLISCGINNNPDKDPYEDYEDKDEIIVKPDTAIDRDGRYIDYINKIGWATGQEAQVSTLSLGIYGTDLGIPFYSQTQERMYFCFGDSYSNNDFGYPWNNNALLYTDSLNFKNGINYSGAVKGITTRYNYGTQGQTLQITPDAYMDENYPEFVTEAYHPSTELDISGSILKTSTCIPTGAIELNGNFYMFYMEVTSSGFGDNGQWCIHSNRVMKSDDLGITWTQLNSLKWDYSFAPNFGQIFPLVVGEYVYIYGLSGGRIGSAKLGRVKIENFEDMSQYEYYTETRNDIPIFVKGNDGLAIIKNDITINSNVINGPCGEMSVIYNEYLNRYIATYQMGNSLILRISQNPYGPFGSADTVFQNGEYDCSSVYGAFANEKMTTNRGRRMYFMMSVWFPVYNVQLMEIVFK